MFFFYLILVIQEKRYKRLSYWCPDFHTCHILTEDQWLCFILQNVLQENLISAFPCKLHSSFPPTRRFLTLSRPTSSRNWAVSHTWLWLCPPWPASRRLSILLRRMHMHGLRLFSKNMVLCVAEGIRHSFFIKSILVLFQFQFYFYFS